MKDKNAAKAKKRRRAVKEAEKKQERDKIISQFDSYAKRRGLEKYNKQTMYKAYCDLDAETTKKSLVYAIIATSYCLHKNYGWGQSRLSEYAKNIHRYIMAIDKQNRTVEKLKVELEIEASMDWTELESYKPYNGKMLTHTQNEGMVFAAKMAYLLPLAIYPLYFNEGWKKKRMNRINSEVFGVIKDIIEKNKILKLKETLRKECKLCYFDDGSIYIDNRKE